MLNIWYLKKFLFYQRCPVFRKDLVKIKKDKLMNTEIWYSLVYLPKILFFTRSL